MPSIWDMLFPGGGQAPQFGGQDPNAQLPVPFPGPQQAPYFGAQMNAQQPVPQDAAPYDLRPIPQLTAPLWRSASDRYRASQFGDETRLPEYNQTGAYGPAFGGGTGSDPRRSPYPVSGPQLMPEVTGPAVPIEDRRAEPGPPAIDQFLNATTGYDRAHWGEMLKHPMTPARDLFSGENSGGAMIHELPIPPLAREAGYDNVGRQYPGGSGALQRAPLRPEQMHALRLMGYLGADQLPIPKQQAPGF